MRKIFLAFPLIVCGWWSASQATASSLCTGIPGNLVTNCGFETGDFTAWTISGNTINPANNYYGVDAFDANSGNFGAYVSQDFIDGGTPPVILSQTLSTSIGLLYSVTFWLQQDTTPTLGYNHALTAQWGSTTMLSLTPTIATPGPVGVFTEYTYSETATNASTVLSFSFENDDNYWSFDDASVATATTPEPSTGVLAAIALCGLAGFLSWKRVVR